MGRRKVPPHNHVWKQVDRPQAGWIYACAICGGKSRNGLNPGETRIVTSFYFGPDGNSKVFQWTPGETPVPHQ